MKKIFNNIIILCCSISLLICTSCTVKKVTVSGIPGTTIHKTSLEQIGTIGPSGTTQIKLDAYEGFYLSKAPNNQDCYIPFAPNTKDVWNLADTAAGFLTTVVFGVFTAGIFPLIFVHADKPFDVTTNNDLVEVKKPVVTPLVSSFKFKHRKHYKVLSLNGLSVERLNVYLTYSENEAGGYFFLLYEDGGNKSVGHVYCQDIYRGSSNDIVVENGTVTYPIDYRLLGAGEGVGEGKVTTERNSNDNLKVTIKMGGYTSRLIVSPKEYSDIISFPLRMAD